MPKADTKIENKTTKETVERLSDIYLLDSGGRFQIRRYDRQPAFAGFLPGIGGPDGVPLWCLYVNRGQAVSSFGVGNKDHALVEFLPANWAYQLAGIQGFRTFCKVDGRFYEPFQNNGHAAGQTALRTMWIEMDRLTLREENPAVGLCFEVIYFSPVNKPVGSLVRMVNITNIASCPLDLEGLDGLPLILPAGFTDVGIKTMRRIYEAYAAVRLVSSFVPFYAAKVAAHDEAEVEEIRRGNFYAAWLSDGECLLPIRPYYDPDVIFGAGQDLVTPRNFIEQASLDPEAQVAENRLPCAMAPFRVRLAPADTITLAALAGLAPSESILVRFLSEFKTLPDFEQTSRQSRRLIRSITEPAFTVSSKPALDAYARQNYLDNVLRGGIPLALPSRSGPSLLHLYARRHGDAERDYNFFDLPACPLSGGEGNYRDICQNRRSDVWFYPDVLDREIRMFVSLLQADGYNPLSIQGYLWELRTDGDPMRWCPTADAEARAAFEKLVSRPFLPGQLLSWSNVYSVENPHRAQWLEDVLSHCTVKLSARGHEGGYWIDHWTYILDLLEAFHAVYPDRTREMLTASAGVEWFVEPARVVERKRKYVRRANGPMQLNAVVDTDGRPAALPPASILGKLCGLLAIKAVSLDYEGRGIEMEAGRPGWNDAMNGLPGLFGSSTCEALETLRLARWLLNVLPDMPDVELPEDIALLIDEVSADLRAEYNWDRACRIRETFRQKIYETPSLHRTSVAGSRLRELLEGIVARFEDGLRRSIDPGSGLLHTYFVHRPLDVRDRAEDSGDGSLTGVDIRRFSAEPLPLFLEGQVHWLRVCSKEQAARIYRAVRQSPLLDPELQMYKLNECLAACPPEIGRARTFSRGWFENESIWLHMSMKYLLELVRHGLYEEFFTDARTMLVPFMNPAVYGRSILENSSFIASSACPDPGARGRGFVARLSGTTAEFIHLWLLLTVGRQPFTVQEGTLVFALRPALPAEWFTQEEVDVSWREQSVRIPKDAFACALLGSTLLVYRNPDRRDTFGSKAARPVRYLLDDGHEIGAPEISGSLAERIRNREIRRIDVWLG